MLWSNEDFLGSIENSLGPELRMHQLNEELEKQLDVLAHAKDKELEALKAENQQLREKRDEVQEERDKVKKEKAQLKISVAEVESRVKAERDRIEKEKQKSLDLEKQKYEKRVETKIAEHKVQTQRSKEKLRAKIAELEENNDALSKSKSKLEKENKTYHTTQVVLAEKNDNLSRQLEDARLRFPIHDQDPQL
jgi:chromosome segregation ATPase